MLFLDIVGSTPIAEELGDEAWRSLLGRFRAAVRREVKRSEGHEVDTAGDGFFATFPHSTAGLEAARAIVEAVQDVGVDVRVGLHAGEVESDAKHVSGVTVHIGARVMALASPAQILVTSTVRDMERGGSTTFAEAGEHALKGIEGTWRLFSLLDAAGQAPPAPLDPDLAAERRRTVRAISTNRRIRIFGAVALVAVLIGSVLLVARSRGTRAPPLVATRPAMVKVDLASHKIVTTVNVPTTEKAPVYAPGNVGDEIVRVTRDYYELRDLSTGELRDKVPVPQWYWVSIGAGSLWVDSGSGVSEPVLYRLAPQTGRTTGRSREAGAVADPPVLNIWWGSDGGWTFDVSAMGDSLLVNLDPVTLQVEKWHLPLGNWQIPVPYRGGVWAIDPSNRQLAWFDQGTGKVVDLPIPQGQTLIIEGLDTYSPRRIWLFDPNAELFTPLGEGAPDRSGEFFVDGAPPELSDPENVMYADGPVLDGTLMDRTLWIVAPEAYSGGRSDSVAIGVKTDDPGTPPVVVPMPAGFEAYFLIADAADRSIWVSG